MLETSRKFVKFPWPILKSPSLFIVFWTAMIFNGSKKDEKGLNLVT